MDMMGKLYVLCPYWHDACAERLANRKGVGCSEQELRTEQAPIEEDANKQGGSQSKCTTKTEFAKSGNGLFKAKTTRGGIL